jgi:D-threo-aldose 1-dehydrogenase
MIGRNNVPATSLSLSGRPVPPIVFGTAALGNVPHVIPEQRKLEICGEWFQQVESPVFIDAAYAHGDGLALEVLGRMLQRLDVKGDEVVIHLTLDANRVADNWEKSCRLLGSKYRPKLVSICNADESAWRAISQLKAAALVLGTGVVARDLGSLSSLTPSVDWVVLTGGFTPMRHPAELLASMAELAARKIPVVVSGVFDGGFLVGNNRLDGRVLSAEDPADRSLLTWRTSFAALCHGHGITPAQACIQFALSGPAVVAVLLNSSHPDRVAENIASVERAVPDAFWESMKEEGLLAADYPHVSSTV